MRKFIVILVGLSLGLLGCSDSGSNPQKNTSGEITSGIFTDKDVTIKSEAHSTLKKEDPADLQDPLPESSTLTEEGSSTNSVGGEEVVLQIEGRVSSPTPHPDAAPKIRLEPATSATPSATTPPTPTSEISPVPKISSDAPKPLSEASTDETSPEIPSSTADTRPSAPNSPVKPVTPSAEPDLEFENPISPQSDNTTAASSPNADVVSPKMIVSPDVGSGLSTDLANPGSPSTLQPTEFTTASELVLPVQDDKPPLVDTAPPSPLVTTTPSLETASTPMFQPEEVYQHLLHNDLRAVVKKHDAELLISLEGDDLFEFEGTAKDVLMTAQKNAYIFSGADTVYYMDKDLFGNQNDKLKVNSDTGRAAVGITPIGPEGDNENEFKELYIIKDHRLERRKNVIFSFSYEKIVRTSPSTYNIDLMMFMHSDSIPNGYIFRIINVDVDLKNRNSQIQKKYLQESNQTKSISTVSFKKVIKEIPLSKTDFEIRVELSTQKGLLIDKNYGLIKVFPLTAGAIDSRSLKDPRKVNSMTLLLPGSKIKYKNFELKDTVLVKRSLWFDHKWNTHARVRDAGYKGRPFIGLIDRSRLPKNEDGSFKTYKTYARSLSEDDQKIFSLYETRHFTSPRVSDPNGTPFYPRGYRQIGFHYQIVAAGLKRGFESHGCIRLQDHDLYTIDAIVNSGPKDLVPVEVKMILDDYKDLDSVYTRSDNYKKVVYTDTPEPSPFTVHCKKDSSYPVRSFHGRNGQTYHTIADAVCLTKIKYADESVETLTAALTGASDSEVTTLLTTDPITKTHSSIRNRMAYIRNNESYVLAVRPESAQNTSLQTYLNSLTNFGSGYTEDRRLQLEQIDLVEKIKVCVENPSDEACQVTAADVAPIIPQATARTNQRWERIKNTLTISRIHRDEVGPKSYAIKYVRRLRAKAFNPYQEKCEGRRKKTREQPCGAWLHALKLYWAYEKASDPLVDINDL